jgi:hypothetical protein
VTADAGGIEDLLRWEAAGGTWTLELDGPDGVVLALLRCDGGERVGTLVSDDPRVREHVRLRG